ncbi:hypothetical protein LX83_001635 [Goodfellowiella coeruleoviolacea]|uniref:Uncharacterized protein n=1 Tax=Goodfellowiella coeruleoviolacea TaxID=334858 RepID=A0AAE3KFC0_9PSEU|nr:hypothetical protein [Goodfellowiella coeruleoviolacea]
MEFAVESHASRSPRVPTSSPAVPCWFLNALPALPVHLPARRPLRRPARPTAQR